MATHKFIVSSASLLKAIKQVSAVITNSPIVPILENVLLVLHRDGTKSHLHLYGSDMETELRTSLAVEATGEAWEMCVPSRILQQTLGNLPDQPITVTIDLDSYRIEVRASRSRFKLAGENGANFPRFRRVEPIASLELAGDTLRDLLGATVPFVSDDTLRPAMTAVYVKVNERDNQLTMVATNGHFLTRAIANLMGEVSYTGGLLLPGKIPGKLLLNLLKASPYVTPLLIGTDWLETSVSGVTLRCRLVDERYPDYENVLPVNNPHKLVIDQQELSLAVREVAVLANKTSHQVRFDLGGETGLKVSAEDLDFSQEGEVKVSAQYDGDPMATAFNAKYLQALLSGGALPAGEVVASFGEPNRAMVIEPTDKSGINYLALLMPCALNHY